MPAVVIAAYNVAAFPEGGGHFWVYLQYALGLRALGCDVYWLEGFPIEGLPARNAATLATFRERMKRYGFRGNSILYFRRSQKPSRCAPVEYADMSREEAEAI